MGIRYMVFHNMLICMWRCYSIYCWELQWFRQI